MEIRTVCYFLPRLYMVPDFRRWKREAIQWECGISRHAHHLAQCLLFVSFCSAVALSCVYTNWNLGESGVYFGVRIVFRSSESTFPIKTGRRTTVFEPCEKPTPVVVCCCDSETNVPQILHFLAQIGTRPLGSCSAHVRAAFDGSHETTGTRSSKRQGQNCRRQPGEWATSPGPKCLGTSNLQGFQGYAWSVQKIVLLK